MDPTSLSAACPLRRRRGSSYYRWRVKVLFAREQFNEGIPWSELAPLLPGWTIETCTREQVTDAAVDVDVVCPFGARIDRDVIAGSRFGLIQQFGVGVDGVDLDAANEYGVWVARLPGQLTGNADSVAELAICHVLSLLRRVDDARAGLRDGRWGQPVSRSLSDTTVLVVGLGSVGDAVVTRLQPFGPRLIAVRAHPERGAPEGVDEVLGVAELGGAVASADVIIGCATLDAASRGLFSAEVLARLRPGSVFVNVARGGLVDEDALLAALDDGRLAGAGLDVFATEPAEPQGRLVTHPRVIATPHVAGLTETMFRRSGELFAQNLREWAASGCPAWAANAPTGPIRQPR
jgi:phosphoglycerate dehydrogenase-like enzyme